MRSPTFTLVMSFPTSSTMPATSQPAIEPGEFLAPTAFQSVGLSATAFVFSSSQLSAGCLGRGTSLLSFALSLATWTMALCVDISIGVVEMVVGVYKDDREYHKRSLLMLLPVSLLASL